MFIYRLTAALEKNGVSYAIVGGFALALHGAVRGTVDIDLVLALSEKNFLAAENALDQLGFKSRLPLIAKEVFQFRQDYIKKRDLVAWNFYNPKNPIELVDIIITHDLSKMKTVSVQSQGHTLKVLSVKDLIAMKKESGRPQDLEDIKALERLKK